MAVSLFEALVMGPMLSTYLGKKTSERSPGRYALKKNSNHEFLEVPLLYFYMVLLRITIVTTKFGHFQDYLSDRLYACRLTGASSIGFTW